MVWYNITWQVVVDKTLIIYNIVNIQNKLRFGKTTERLMNMVQYIWHTICYVYHRVPNKNSIYYTTQHQYL